MGTTLEKTYSLPNKNI